MAYLLNKMPDDLIEDEENPILQNLIYNSCLLEQTRFEINNEITNMKKTIENLTAVVENINERI